MNYVQLTKRNIMNHLYNYNKNCSKYFEIPTIILSWSAHKRNRPTRPNHLLRLFKVEPLTLRLNIAIVFLVSKPFAHRAS
jgi:hypothetical protein